MTDDPTDDLSESELDDVRRLLAEARHTAPMPDDVVARMDVTLADLAREPRAEPEPGPEPEAGSRIREDTTAPVITIEAHRRRRASRLLLAAAAIVVGGAVVVPHIHLDNGAASQSAGEAQSQADASGSDYSAGGNSSQPASPSAPVPTALNGSKAGPARTRDGRVVVRPGHFPADALAAESLLSTKAAHDSLRLQDLSTCLSAPSDAQVLPASYQRAPAALVFRRPQGSTQIVDLVLCGQASPTRSVTLPLP